MNNLDYALAFKAMGDETRLKIIGMLKNGPLCACKILDALQCTQPTLSYHMKMLCDSDLVTSKKDGKWMYYTLNRSLLKQLAEFVCSL